MIIKAAVAQMDVQWQDVSQNKDKAVSFFEEAAKKNAELIVFPEMTFTGFSMGALESCEYSLELTEFMCSCSKRYKINSVFGLAELSEGNRAKNISTAISEDGEIIAKYAKIHPLSFSSAERYYEGGTEITTFKIKDIGISMFICYDIRFPEVFQAVSNDVSIITVIANWPAVRLSHWELFLRARAVENQCFIVGANRIGFAGYLSYSGGSAMISPRGDVLCSNYETEALLIYDIDTESVTSYREKFPLKKDRKDTFYKSLYK